MVVTHKAPSSRALTWLRAWPCRSFPFRPADTISLKLVPAADNSFNSPPNNNAHSHPDSFLYHPLFRVQLLFFFALAPTPALAPMSSRPSSSASDTGSQSSSPGGYADLGFDPLLFDSPYSNASSLSQSPEEQHRHTPPTLRDATATVSQPSSEPSQPSTPKLGGCWTCRLRRKKCDEQRAEDGACATCRRLKLKCLGWGARRPDWMRDKEEVQRYKAEIKAHLLRQGLIRGQPRAGFISTEQRPSSRRNPSAHTLPYARPVGTNNIHPNGWNMHYNTLSTPADFLPNAFAAPSGLPAPILTEAGALLVYDSTPPPTGPVIPSPIPPSSSGLAADGFSVPPLGGEDPRQSLISYYFSDVKALNYANTCITARSALWQTLTKQRNGPLESALCAIADVHCQREENRSTGAMYTETHLSQFYYNEAMTRLEVSRRSGRLSSADAAAASQMVSYCLATTGGTSPGSEPRWLNLVELSCDYVAQLNLLAEPLPRNVLRDMAPENALAVKVTMAMDILLSVTIQQPPRLLAVWRHVLGNTRGAELFVHRHVGCTDAVLLMLGETAALAHWKAVEQQKGTLNVRVLFDRAGAIERALQQHAEQSASATPLSQPGQVDDQISVTAGGELVPAGVDEQACRHLVARIWWGAAVLYLKTAVHGHNPAVEGVAGIIADIVRQVSALPVTGLDRALAVPLLLAAAASDVPEYRSILVARLANIDRSSTNVQQMETVLQDVWRRRDAGIVQNVDWRDVMRANGTTLLLL
ncbi:fungal-specific transcription factor domain-containing protein [Vararia minispora EC-137]|uniref:Fungal-specific transcription factor domain-containing protein n=1 Tax=Vararia minispora EC-137 TaxID=1314806 RepID=A0ACB8Q774_9AGAM|nr:fungal-specific transcription factor domain-containing protein [Vararia minispora EC-137]